MPRQRREGDGQAGEAVVAEVQVLQQRQPGEWRNISQLVVLQVEVLPRGGWATNYN